MQDNNPSGSNQGPDMRTGHETSDPNVKAIAVVGALLLVTLGITLGFAWGVMEAHRHETAPPPVATVEGLPRTPVAFTFGPTSGPNLQVDPHLDLLALRAREDQSLTSYAWIDQKSGIVRIPVERAMKLVAERGLPARTSNAHPVSFPATTRWESTVSPPPPERPAPARAPSSENPNGARKPEKPPADEPRAGPGSPLTDDRLARIEFDQRLDAAIPPDLEFRDTDGRQVQLGDLLQSSPAILVLGYYRCPMLCDVVLNGLVECLQDIRTVAGGTFKVIMVSIDPKETPALAAAKKEAYLRRYGRDPDGAGWHFLTGNPPEIERLAETVGFRYAYDASIQQYAHPSGILVVTPSARVSRYFFGVRFPPAEVKKALDEAAAERVGSPMGQLILLCFHYSPLRGKYSEVVMRLVKAGGVAMMIGLAVFGMVCWRGFREKREVTRSSDRGTNASRDGETRQSAGCDPSGRGAPREGKE